MQQIVYSQYGNVRSYYGNLAYGQAPKYLQAYGAWPEVIPAQKEMLVSDWQEPTVEESLIVPTYAEEISNRIDIIKNLKAQIEAEQDLKLKNQYREQMRIEREAKERAFKLKSLVDEEESLFIIFN